MTNLSARDRIAFALDVHSREEALRWVDTLQSEIGVFKVGLQLFISEGPRLLKDLAERNVACFLDLKIHDIPATVERAVHAAVAHQVRYVTVHAASGPEALRRAASCTLQANTKILAVTVLTSFSDTDLEAIGMMGNANAAAHRLARVSFDCGVRGFVCAPLECASLRQELGPEAHLVTPGIRRLNPGGSADDQKRTETATTAITHGADLLVVGRPIREAPDPLASARSILNEIEVASSRNAS
ncbi:MAG: orotidine-5'-phosphate decarboxylase [Myxococcota bacterium]